VEKPAQWEDLTADIALEQNLASEKWKVENGQRSQKQCEGKKPTRRRAESLGSRREAIRLEA
jgi:hypothetical protein